MAALTRIFFYSMVSILLLSIFSCDDDESAGFCDQRLPIEGTFTINDERRNIAEVFYVFTEPSSVFPDSEFHRFFFASLQLDCNTFETIEIDVELEAGAGLEGTYEFDTSRDRGAPYGGLITRLIEDVEESSTNFISGTLSVVELGEREFELSINAQTDEGNQFTMEVSSFF